ncbi:MAG TPA: hypothetical protein VFX96_17565 [Pyrinomonadaceae bacterium]|nr:hypothetical protein [Pyrinomonadaceae bacterium]
MSERNLHALASPGFLAGLSLLLLNDFVFKEQFHNGLTGKLSDFAGLFVFPLFWAALFPRLKLQVYVSTAVLFAFWKSPYSQPAIDVWNGLRLLPFERTIDYTDLLALTVLPLSYAYGRAPARATRVPRPALYSIALVSLFAFTATQFSKRVSYDNEYPFQSSREELLTRMSRLPANDVLSDFSESDTFDVSFDSCTGSATVTVSERGSESVITLKEIEHRCPSEPDRRQMLEYFERQFIDRLREEPVRKSSQVTYIWGKSPPGAAAPTNNAAQPTPRRRGSGNSSPRR